LVQYPGSKKDNISKSDSSLALLTLPDMQERWRIAKLRVEEAVFSENGNVIACIEHEDMAGRDDIGGNDASRLTVIDTNNGKTLMRHPLGISLEHLLVTKDGTRVIAFKRGFSDIIFIVDVKTGIIRRLALPVSGIWSQSLTIDEKELWAAGSSLYRINLDTMAINLVAAGNFTALTPRQGGGMYAGSDENAAIVEFGADGIQLSTTSLADDMPYKNRDADFAQLRDTPLTGSTWLKPHEIGTDIPLVPEYPYFGNTADTISLRADAVFPVNLAVHIPTAGKYRIILDVPIAKDKGDVIKPFRVLRGSKTLGQTSSLQGDAWKQALEIDLETGTYIISIAPIPPWQNGWKQDAPLRSMRIEKL
jgi:hypothetical protein